MPARCAVGARARGFRRCQRMQRVQADEARAARRQPTNQLLQIAEISYPPIVVGTQGVQLHGNAPESPALDDGGRLVAYGWRHHQRTASHRACHVDFQFVVSRRQVHRHLQPTTGNPGSFDLAAPQFRAIRGRDATRTMTTGLQIHGPQQSRPEIPCGDIEVNADARAACTGDLRQQASPA